MAQLHSLEDRVAEHYGTLSSQLRKAADYVVSHPLDIASRSLRMISEQSDVSPATYSRLSRALGFESFEELKDLSRQSLGKSPASLAERAQQLKSDARQGRSMLQRQSAACIGNIEEFVGKADEAKLEEAATLLRSAERVVLLGALASTGITEYMAYLAEYFGAGWTLAGRMGASLGAQFSGLAPGDVVFIVTKAPYARRAMVAADMAARAGAAVITVTDSHKCPTLAKSRVGLVVPSQSPQFFSSYVVTLVLIETLIAMIVAASQTDIAATIHTIEAANQELGEYWSE
ncbi:MurR/RpiR family transcriptional regulator [Roseobacteraceae bacterium S113]